MNSGGRTEVMTGGRHRPSAIAAEYDDYDYDLETERRRRQRRGWIIALSVLGAVLVVVLGALLLPKLFSGSGSGGSGQLQVPNVVGQQQAQASQTINQDKLVAAIKQVTCQAPAGGAPPCTADQVGKVISTDPPAGSNVNQGATVTLSIGAPAQPVTVPDLTNMTPAQATAALQRANLQLSQQTPNTQPVTDPNQVARSSRRTRRPTHRPSRAPRSPSRSARHRRTCRCPTRSARPWTTPRTT